MQHSFKAISLSYKQSPLNIREQVSLNEGEAVRVLSKMREMLAISEALVLSTCNRTEIYYTSEQDLTVELVKLIVVEKGGHSSEEVLPYFNSLNSPKVAINHLFRVAMGLESQVVGDLQITNQVKKAYQWSVDQDMAGPFLHRLLHSIFFTNKRVVQETAFRDGAASVSYAAVEMLEELLQDFVSPKVLVIGIGEIGADVVRNLQHTDITDVTIINRTESRAALLAEQCDYQSKPFDQLWQEAEKADAIICSVGLSEPLINIERVQQFNILSHKCFMDLAVPRSVEEGLEEAVSGAIVYNIDDINNRASAALQKRKNAIPHVEEVINEAIHDFEEWAKNIVFSPVIQQIKDSLEQIRQEEMKKYLKKLSESEAAAAEKVSKSMIQKIVKLHVLQFKEACKRGDAENLADTLNDLFNFEPKAVAKK